MSESPPSPNCDTSHKRSVPSAEHERSGVVEEGVVELKKLESLSAEREVIGPVCSVRRENWRRVRAQVGVAIRERDRETEMRKKERKKRKR